MRWSRFVRRAWWSDERRRELEAYLAIETDEHVARGMTPDDAALAARRKLGNVTRLLEEIYDMNSLGWIDGVWRDVRYGARLLWRNPTFAAVAVLSLALGIGANTAIFQLVEAVRLRTLPVAHPEQLAEVHIQQERGFSGSFNGRRPMLTNALWERIRDRQQAFSSVFAWHGTEFELSRGGESRPAEGVFVSGNYFSTLDVKPLLGRLLVASDDRRGCSAPPAVISYAFWQREYGGSPSAVGRPLMLDGRTFDIAGITPASFFGLEVGHPFDIAVPLCVEPAVRGGRSALTRKDGWFLAVVGRLNPGWTLARATAHLESLSPPMFEETLPNYGPEDKASYLAFRLGAYSAQTGVSNLRGRYGSPLWLLLGTTGLVLLIACANLANLMLARATAREREIAVRLSLGASRRRIVRQLLAESVLIAIAGAAVGALLAQTLSQAMVASLTTADDRIVVDVAGNWRVFSFLAALAAAACGIFGLMPAIRATATAPAAAMKAGSRGSTDTRERFGIRRVLVVAQVALSLVLVVGALLFVRTLRNLATLDPGFSRGDVLIASIDLRRAGIAEDGTRPAFAALLDGIRHAPGIEEAAQVRVVPVSGGFSNRTIIVDGVRRSESVNRNVISDRYFDVTRTPLLAGRDFDVRDAAAAPRVAIVTESFARLFFGGANPVGRTFQVEEPPGQARPMYEIVGFARDSKYEDLRDAFAPLMFVPAAQDDQPAMTQRLLVRPRQSLATAVSGLTAAVRQLHPSAVVQLRTMEAQIHDSLLPERLMATLSGAFGALAVLIAVVGLYGVMSYSVARRRNEIGIRIALGADRREVVSMVMREAGLLLGAGLVVGTIASLAAGQAAAALLFGLKPHDPVTLLGAMVGLSAVAALAGYVPAWRAARIDPAIALRDE